MKLWIGNLSPGTSADKVRQLLQKYGLPRPERIKPVLEGTRPAMLIEFETDDVEKLRRLIWRIEGLYWEGSHLIVTPLHFR